MCGALYDLLAAPPPAPPLPLGSRVFNAGEGGGGVNGAPQNWGQVGKRPTQHPSKRDPAIKP